MDSLTTNELREVKTMNTNRESIPVAEYKNTRFPDGGPCIQTLRSYIDDNILDGYSIPRGKRKYYFVYIDSPVLNISSEAQAILREIQ